MTNSKKRADYLAEKHGLSSKVEKDIFEELNEHFIEARDVARDSALEDAARSVELYVEENIDEDDSSLRSDLRRVAKGVRALKMHR